MQRTIWWEDWRKERKGTTDTINNGNALAVSPGVGHLVTNIVYICLYLCTHTHTDRDHELYKQEAFSDYFKYLRGLLFLVSWAKTKKRCINKHEFYMSIWFYFTLVSLLCLSLQMTACCPSPSSKQPMRSCHSPLSRCPSTTQTPPSLRSCSLRVCRPWRHYWLTSRWRS